jgi:hypothetical protein
MILLARRPGPDYAVKAEDAARDLGVGLGWLDGPHPGGTDRDDVTEGLAVAVPDPHDPAVPAPVPLVNFPGQQVGNDRLGPVQDDQRRRRRLVPHLAQYSNLNSISRDRPLAGLPPGGCSLQL